MEMKIAICDDHSIVREGLEMMLSTHFGIKNISNFSNGTDLLKGIEHNTYNLIILDIFIPLLLFFS